ncbi:hypothetical protein RF11_14473 [Thelohanellus kitauei]|uniref:Uncharacterized protein n=1 Tax=Thelohanellus kitauei TaxID=669202 RepID=A0A0C2JQ92_THEKT|nr:hypothetical protein RF11_14473 [Thelohanellus kitauei]
MQDFKDITTGSMVQDLENTNVENNDIPIFSCPGTKKRKCDCIQNYTQKEISSGSNRKFKNQDEANKYFNEMGSKALILLKEPYVEDNLDEGTTARRNMRRKSRWKKKSKRYVEYIMNTREKLKENGICEVSCRIILRYSHFYERPMTNANNGENSVIIVIKSNRSLKIKLNDLMVKRCCWRNCNQLLCENTPYYKKLRQEAKMSNVNKRAAIRTLIDFSKTERKVCKKFIYQVLHISRGTLKTVKEELKKTARTDTRVTNNASQSVPTRISRRPHPIVLSQNQPQSLPPIPGTINRPLYQPNDRLFCNSFKNIGLSPQKTYQHINRAFYREENWNLNDKIFPNHFSKYQPLADANLHSAPVNANQNLGNQILCLESVNTSYNQMAFPNPLQQNVQMPYCEHKYQTFQPNLTPVHIQHQNGYPNIFFNPNYIPEVHTDVVSLNSDTFYVLIPENNELRLIPLDGQENIIQYASPNTTHQAFNQGQMKNIHECISSNTTNQSYTPEKMINIHQFPSSNATNHAFTQEQWNNIQQCTSLKGILQVVNPESQDKINLYLSQNAKYPVFQPVQQNNILYPLPNFTCQDNIDQYPSHNDTYQVDHPEPRVLIQHHPSPNDTGQFIDTDPQNNNNPLHSLTTTNQLLTEEQLANTSSEFNLGPLMNIWQGFQHNKSQP